MPTVFNAANEIAVQAFLERRLGFLDIATVVETAMAEFSDATIGTLDDVLRLDGEARRFAEKAIASHLRSDG